LACAWAPRTAAVPGVSGVIVRMGALAGVEAFALLRRKKQY